MQQSCFILGNLEGAGVGLNFENANETINHFSFTRGMFMLFLSMIASAVQNFGSILITFISMIIFLVIGAYLGAVLPRSVGERSHPCFCFTVCCKKRH